MKINQHVIFYCFSIINKYTENNIFQQQLQWCQELIRQLTHSNSQMRERESKMLVEKNYLAEVRVTLHEEGLEKYDMVVLLHKPFNHCTKYTEATSNYRTK